MNKDEEVTDTQRHDIRRLCWWVLTCFVGTVASVVALVLLLFDEIKKVKGQLAVAHAAEATASAARTQLRAVIDAVPARIGAHDRTGCTIFRNRYAAERTGDAADDAAL